MKHVSWMITALILMGTMASCGGEDTAASPQTTTEAVAGESSVETEEVFYHITGELNKKCVSISIFHTP